MNLKHIVDVMIRFSNTRVLAPDSRVLAPKPRVLKSEPLAFISGTRVFFSRSRVLKSEPLALAPKPLAFFSGTGDPAPKPLAPKAGTLAFAAETVDLVAEAVGFGAYSFSISCKVEAKCILWPNGMKCLKAETTSEGKKKKALLRTGPKPN